ncbi:hypothetical protein ASG90_11155 [Nocardioides sp. Soil797]|nr:hypothetical protein ASG90_11155 [Nocardioides sp. Soil797]
MTDTRVGGVSGVGGSGRDASGAVSVGDYLPPIRAVWVYRLQRGSDEHVGVVADVSILGFADGRVRGHEAVSSDRVAGLVDHFASVPGRAELVALLHDAGEQVDRVVASAREAPPVVDFTGTDGWRQSVWQVPDTAGLLLADALGRAVHYIADGHHRVAASLALWERAGRPADSALLCVLYSMDGLRLRAYRRRVSGPVDPSRLRGLLAECCAVTEGAPGELPSRGTRAYVDGTWLTLDPTVDRAAGVEGLDLTILQRHVLAPLLGAVLEERVESIPVTVPLDELVSRCDADGGALFVLAPPTHRQMREIADRGQVMPPKTTYFDPKPSAGVFLR